MNAWQYQHLVLTTDVVANTTTINALGAEGWEAVGLVTVPGHSKDDTDLIYLLKRPAVRAGAGIEGSVEGDRRD